MTPVSEFDDWQAYFRMRRGQHEKADWHAASICHTIAAVNGGKASLSDYLLKFQEPEQTKPDSKEVWLSLFGMSEDGNA